MHNIETKPNLFMLTLKPELVTLLFVLSEIFNQENMEAMDFPIEHLLFV